MKLKSFFFVSIIIFFSIFESATIASVAHSSDHIKASDIPTTQLTSRTYPIIWFHNAATTDPKWLEIALSSGLITKVLILYMNPSDVDCFQIPVTRAIAVCHRYRVPVIWCRTLFASDKPGNFTREDLFNSRIYENIIMQVKAEARLLSCDYTAIDSEAYGLMPLKKELKQRFPIPDFQRLFESVKTAVRNAGQVDYVLPAVSVPKTHPYNAFIQIGRLKIAEHTYYDNPAIINDQRRPYDVMGVYINIVKVNPNDPLKRPFFTVEEVFQESFQWRSKNGLMLYPKEDMVPEIAVSLSRQK